MSIEASDFPSRLRAQVHLQGAMLTEVELSHLGACYPGCAGTGQWDVREYARVAPDSPVRHDDEPRCASTRGRSEPPSGSWPRLLVARCHAIDSEAELIQIDRLADDGDRAQAHTLVGGAAVTAMTGIEASAGSLSWRR